MRISLSPRGLRIAAVITGLLSAILFFPGLALIEKGKSSESWPGVPGKILASQTSVIEFGRGADRNKPFVQYSYKTPSGEKVGERIWLGAGRSEGGCKPEEKIGERYPVGRRVTVYVNPKNDTETLLQPGVPDGAYALIVLSGIALAVTVALILYARKLKARR